jgi:Uma2 family endonuclease
MTQSPLKTPIFYPEPDGAPMAESDPTRDYLVYSVEALKLYFQKRSDVYVSGNLWLSYQQGVPDAVVAPDVFVVFGVENRQRRSYKVWEENGKTPDWVLEVTSRSTRHKDEQEKPHTYAQMGVTEYFQYDPTGDYLNPPLKGRRLEGNTYSTIAPTSLADGTLCFPSQVLGLEMHLLTDGKLRFFHPQTGEYLRTYGEERDRGDREQLRADRERLEKEQERLRAEQESQRAEQESQRAEQESQRAEQERLEKERQQQRASKLAARLRELGIDPDAD